MAATFQHYRLPDPPIPSSKSLAFGLLPLGVGIRILVCLRYLEYARGVVFLSLISSQAKDFLNNEAFTDASKAIDRCQLFDKGSYFEGNSTLAVIKKFYPEVLQAPAI